jgi:hypothetical protein
VQPKRVTLKVTTVLYSDEVTQWPREDPILRAHREAKHYKNKAMLDETVVQNTLATTGHLKRTKPVRLHNSRPNLTLKHELHTN